MKNLVAERFTEFYEKWVWKLEEILQQLLEVSKQRDEVVKSEEELQALVGKVTAHLKEYYTVKWAMAHEDVQVFFYPTWVSPLENAYLWMSGWKPSMVFKIVENLKKGSTFVLDEEQGKKIEELRVKTKMEEDKVEREMERIQVAMADRKIVELVKLTRNISGPGCSSGSSSGDGDGGERYDALVEVALKGVFSGLEKVMKGSDCVRLKTLKGVLDVLTPMQCVDFLAANITTHLRLRQWGKKRDEEVPTEQGKKTDDDVPTESVTPPPSESDK